MQEVAPATRSGGCRRIKMCTMCTTFQTPLMLSWRGNGQFQWGCVTRCGDAGHGALTTFHEIPNLRTPATVRRSASLLKACDTKVNLQAELESTSTKRKRGPTEDCFSEHGHDGKAHLQKRARIASAPPSTSFEDAESDKENFVSFEEEYKYYAAEIRRLLGEDPTKPRTYPRAVPISTTTLTAITTAQLAVAKPAMATVNHPRQLSRDGHENLKSQSTAITQEPGIPPKLVHEIPTNKLVSNDKNNNMIVQTPWRTVGQLVPPNNGNQDCGCSTILCMHRVGERQSVKDMPLDRRR